MIDVSIVGTVCNSFTQCLNIVEQDRNINYQGPNLDRLRAQRPQEWPSRDVHVRRHWTRYSSVGALVTEQAEDESARRDRQWAAAVSGRRRCR